MQINKMLAAVALLVLVGAGICTAHAQGVGEDGCQVLEEMVAGPVAAAGGVGQVALLPSGGVVTTCSATASAVSAGFTRALAQMNLYVSWPTPFPTPGPTPTPGDLCLSPDLSQCYPEQFPYLPAMSVADAAFVANNWEAVRRAVYLSMPAGVASDVSRFSSTFLKVNLEQRIKGVAPKYSMDY